MGVRPLVAAPRLHDLLIGHQLQEGAIDVAAEQLESVEAQWEGYSADFEYIFSKGCLRTFSGVQIYIDYNTFFQAMDRCKRRLLHIVRIN